MYNVSYTIEEFQALKDILECSISEIHSEIIHTDRRELKTLLKNRKQVLMKMLDDIQNIQAAAQGA